MNRRVTNEGEKSLQREILVSGAIVDQLRTSRTETYTITARLIADSPTLKAAMSTDDPPTVQGNIQKYGPLLNSANLLLVTDAKGRVMATTGDASAAADVAKRSFVAAFDPCLRAHRARQSPGSARTRSRRAPSSTR